jgi:Domain of unknown function (DUF4296)
MQRLITFGILLCMLGSTHRDPSVKLLTQEEMIPILVDLEVARAMAWHYAADEHTARGLFKKNALLIYQAYDTDLNTFQKNCQYYFAHIEIMKEIYDLVVKRLEDFEEQI